ncbi:MAG: sigma-70 family RNA polymerase sigma factor [Eubacteriales bacterium]
MFVILFSALTDDEKNKFEKLYNHYKNLMMYIALDILKNKELAEDTVHDAMIAILKVINDIEVIESHKTYGLVVLIIRRCSFNKLKYEKRRNHVTDEVFDYIVAEEKAIDEKVITKEEFKKVLQEMKELSIYDAEIIILKYYYGYTYREIANRIDISEANARKRCERAKKQVLKNLYKKEG